MKLELIVRVEIAVEVPHKRSLAVLVSDIPSSVEEKPMCPAFKMRLRHLHVLVDNVSPREWNAHF